MKLARRITEINGYLSLRGHRMAAGRVGLEAPLLDRGNRRSAQNEISLNNLEIFDASIASDYGPQHHRSVKFLRQTFLRISRGN